MAVLVGLAAGCRTRSPDDEPLTPLPAFHAPVEPGPDSVPPEFRYPKRVFDAGAPGLGKVDAG